MQHHTLTQILMGMIRTGFQIEVVEKKLQPIAFDPMNHYYLVLDERAGQVFHDGAVLK